MLEIKKYIQWIRIKDTILTAITCAIMALYSTGPASAEEEKVLNIYHWSDYIADDTISNFEKETGIKVRFDVFDNNEILHAKLVTGKTGYDIVVPSSNWANLQLKSNLFQKLDKTQLPNLVNMNPALQKQIARIDPDNEHLVIWMWGYTTLGINEDKVKAALGDLPMPKNEWDLMFDPTYVSKLKSCGVSILDSSSEVMPIALHYIGKSSTSENASDYQEAGEMLKKIRPYVTLFSSSGYINDLANGSTCLALGWSGDISIAKVRAKEQNQGVKVRVLIPSAGTELFFDTMAIPADAEHPGNALKFMNYIMQPEVAASLTNAVHYANPNSKSRPFVDPEIAADETVFLKPEDLEKMFPAGTPSTKIRRILTRTFTQFKSGL